MIFGDLPHLFKNMFNQKRISTSTLKHNNVFILTPYTNSSQQNSN